VPRYFFDIAGNDPLIDVDGEILDNLSDARTVAVRILGQILLLRRTELFEGGLLRLQVRDVEDRIVHRLEVTSSPGV
jgi:hypothetical protein